MKSIIIPISPGELWDRITILTLKAEKIADPKREAVVRSERSELLFAVAHLGDVEIDALVNKLVDVNRAIWEAENEMRACYGLNPPQFAEAATTAMIKNDERTELKRQINLLYGCPAGEIKEYT